MCIFLNRHINIVIDRVNNLGVNANIVIVNVIVLNR